MLNKLILKNWKSHKYNEINFAQGYNVFVGNIGSGKTSIFDAIVFSLFGSTPNVISRKIAVKDLIMSKPIEEEQAEIILEFNINDDNYKIERLLHKTKSSQAKIYKNNVLLRGPKPSDVNEEVEKILGINIDAFMKANYAEQNSIDYFLRLPANERKNLFDNMFDISFYDDISINSRQVNNKLKTKYEELNNKTQEYKKLLENYNIEEINNKIKLLEVENTTLKKEITNSETQINKLKENEIQINKQKIDYETNNNLLNNLLGKEKYLSTELLKLKDSLKNNKKELEEKLKIEKEQKELRNKDKINIEQEYNNIRSKTLYFNNKINDLKTKEQEYNRVNEILKEIPKDINDLVNKLVLTVETTKDKIIENETRIKSLENDLQILEKDIANCPLCTQELTEEHKHEILNNKIKFKTELIENINKDKELYAKQKQEYELRNKQRDFYNRNIELFEKLKTEILDIEKYKKQVLENCEIEKQYKDKLNAIAIEINKFDINIKDIENNLNLQINFETKTKELQKVNEDILIIKNTLVKIIYNPEEHIKIKSELQKEITEMQYKKQIIIEKEKQIKEETFKIEQYNQILKNKDNSERESIILKKYIDDLTCISNVSKKTQEQVRALVVESINIVFQDIWQNIYPYKDFHNIRFNVTEGDYKIELLFNNEYKRELDEYISGGERSSIALALRIAMSLVMKNKLNLIILDEPTHNLDKASVLQLSELFNNYLPQFIEQTFVITHDNNLEQYANNVYYIERNKEEDDATEINVK